MLARARVVHSRLVFSRDPSMCGVAGYVVLRERGLWHFGRKLDSEDDAKRFRRDHTSTHLHAGNTRGLS